MKHKIHGFTLLEMLVVLMIIGMIMGMVGPKIFAKVDESKVKTAAAQIKLLRGAVESMRLDINIYPSAEQGLSLLTQAPSDPALAKRWKGPYLEAEVPMDPWENPYQYAPPESSGKPFKLYSFGADGKPGGVANDQDIGLAAGEFGNAKP